MSGFLSFLSSPGGGALASAGISAGGGFFNNLYNRQQVSFQREANYQMTDYLYEKDLENWNRMNQYNSPASQVQRFREAGLNPALMYEKATPGLASSPPPTKEGSQPGFRAEMPLIDPISQYFDYRVKQKNMDVAQSLIDKNEAETQLKGVELILKNMDKDFKPAQIKFILDEMNQKRSEWPYDLEAKKQNIEKIKQEIQTMVSSMNLNNAQARKVINWLYEWEVNRINIDHVPWYVPPVVGGINNIKELPEKWKEREGLWPWEIQDTVRSNK